MIKSPGLSQYLRFSIAFRFTRDARHPPWSGRSRRQKIPSEIFVEKKWWLTMKNGDLMVT